MAPDGYYPLTKALTATAQVVAPNPLKPAGGVYYGCKLIADGTNACIVLVRSGGPADTIIGGAGCGATGEGVQTFAGGCGVRFNDGLHVTVTGSGSPNVVIYYSA